jgi:hypothetical protein
MKAKIKEGKLICQTTFVGKRPWAARVLGLDPEKLYDRQFLGVRCTPSDVEEGHEKASIALPLEEGAIFELGGWETVNGQPARGYFVIESGRPRAVTREEVSRLLGSEPEEDVEMPF